MQHFEDVLADRPCPLTGCRAALVVGTTDRTGAPLRTVISKESGLVYTDPRPTPDEVRHFYAEEYRVSYKGTAVPKPKHVIRAGRNAKNRLARLRPLLAPGARVLDAGAGGGEFVFVACEAGYRAVGVEPNEGYCKFSVDEYGIDVRNGFYQDLPVGDEPFDCVTLFHVLEHLEEPINALRDLASKAKPGGLVVVEVPSVDATGSAPSQRWHLGHLFNFGRKTLTATGLRAGLTPIDVSTSPDGGVLFAVFRNEPVADPQGDVDAELRGAFDATHRLLAGHSALSHYLRFDIPLARAISKGTRAVSETRAVARYRGQPLAAMLRDLAAGKLR
ncbi:MAG: class I SAM-dependent methyltransferase [Lacipirellulaceae bacterium]